ncbi:MAG: Pvc16 family protein [Leptolyngbyaceae cyanobacterium MO_188.B28]|nr:Pvc16 family protein [Leptolyngbyaceae cyanobacterium MO_188.B28]
MLPAIAQTLANILVGDTSLISTESIDFNPPSSELSGPPGFNLYCYGVFAKPTEENASDDSELVQPSPQASFLSPPRWVDASFLISARDHTWLGKHQLLSEALTSFLKHQPLEEKFLAPELRGNGSLALSLNPNKIISPSTLWASLGVPVRPALYLTITVPIR